MATSHTRWAVVMSRNAGFIDQCVELDFQYPSEGIHRRWDAGSTFAAFYMLMLSIPLLKASCVLSDVTDTAYVHDLHKMWCTPIFARALLWCCIMLPL